ncbi:MAG: TlpA disulfide reductase family protein [Actinomycetota bacterium]|nr:TlpA disulfide reductase family protein [Actinomycetota bacterium]
MKKLFVMAVLALALISIIAGCHKNQPQTTQGGEGTSGMGGPVIGAIAPDFTLPGVDGRTYTLSKLRGKVVLVDFWATWCPPCRESIPELMKLAAQYKGKPFVILGISVDEGNDVLSQIKKFWRQNKVNYVFLAGNDALENTYQIDSIPASFLVAKDGRIAQRFFGFSPDIFPILQGDINQLLK